MHSSPILFLQLIDFLPACSLSLALFFFFLRGAEKVSVTYMQKLLHSQGCSEEPKTKEGAEHTRQGLAPQTPPIPDPSMSHKVLGEEEGMA